MAAHLTIELLLEDKPPGWPCPWGYRPTLFNTEYTEESFLQPGKHNDMTYLQQYSKLFASIRMVTKGAQHRYHRSVIPTHLSVREADSNYYQRVRPLSSN
ncbi:predicted protein [Coccidioides posadasii str. Silveira]|uniref:Predicted protein n=1 Tax=Coccidioides posadasii (strain RMSCC 757 / Silveira) TaxID=443226 RepID=E9D5B7_COCPS|nr:predicted protein [Coccidioides posadasii str. Silveira]